MWQQHRGMAAVKSSTNASAVCARQGQKTEGRQLAVLKPEMLKTVKNEPPNAQRAVEFQLFSPLE
jgi:hypothetical protein